LVPALGKRPLAKLSPQDVQTFLNEKQIAICPHCGLRLLVAGFGEHQTTEHPDKAAETRNPALSARTAKHLLVTLRGALNMAVKWDLVVRNVASLVDPPKVTRPELRVFAPEEARAFIEALRVSASRRCLPHRLL